MAVDAFGIVAQRGQHHAFLLFGKSSLHIAAVHRLPISLVPLPQHSGDLVGIVFVLLQRIREGRQHLVHLRPAIQHGTRQLPDGAVFAEAVTARQTGVLLRQGLPVAAVRQIRLQRVVHRFGQRRRLG